MTRRSILTESQARRDVKVTSIGKRSGKGRGMAVRKREKSQSLTDVGNNEESSPSKIKKRSDEEMEDFCEKKPLSTKKGVKKFGQRGRSCNLEKKLASLCIDAGNTVEIDGTGFTFQRQLYCVLNDTFNILYSLLSFNSVIGSGSMFDYPLSHFLFSFLLHYSAKQRVCFVGSYYLLTGASQSVTSPDVDVDERVLFGREKEFKLLLNSLRTSIEGKSSLSLYVSGPPGSGKTATVTEVLKCLGELYKKLVLLSLFLSYSASF